MTKNEVNIADIIAENYIVPESVFDRKRTKTSHFMLNSIFTNSNLSGTEYFVNAFLGDAEFQTKVERPIFVLFKYEQTDTKWLTILGRLRTKEEYIGDYFCGIQEGKNLIMVVFQVPKKYEKDYDNFIEGKYSKFSPEYKKTFNRYTTNDKAQPVESYVWRVIHKSPELRKELQNWIGNDPKDYTFTDEDELWGIVQDKYEVYRFKPVEDE